MMFLAIIGALNPFELTAIYTRVFVQVKPGNENSAILAEPEKRVS